MSSWDESTLDRLLADCHNIRGDIIFLQKLSANHEVISPADLEELEYERLLEICPDYLVDDHPTVWYSFCESALEMKYEATIRATLTGKPQVTLSSVTLVLTTGGPHIELVADAGNNSLVLNGYWGSDQCTVNVPYEGLLEHLLEYGDEIIQYVKL